MSASGTGLKITGSIRFDSASVLSTSQTQRSDFTASGETTNTTVSACAIRPPSRASQSSPAHVVAVEERREAGKLQPRDQLVGEVAIPARIGDEDLGLVGAAASADPFVRHCARPASALSNS